MKKLFFFLGFVVLFSFSSDAQSLKFLSQDDAIANLKIAQMELMTPSTAGDLHQPVDLNNPGNVTHVAQSIETRSKGLKMFAIASLIEDIHVSGNSIEVYEEHFRNSNYTDARMEAEIKVAVEDYIINLIAEEG